MVNGSWLMVKGSIVVQDSWFMVNGEWLMVNG